MEEVIFEELTFYEWISRDNNDPHFEHFSDQQTIDRAYAYV